MSLGSRSAIRISSLLCDAFARMRPKGSAMKLPPQNSMPECGRVVAGAVEFYGGGVAVGGGDFEFDVAVLVAYAVDGADEDSVGDGVGALGGLPGVVLGGAELFFFGGVPADGGGEEEDLGSAEGGEAGAFGVPLVPADESADGAWRWFAWI